MPAMPFRGVGNDVRSEMRRERAASPVSALERLDAPVVTETAERAVVPRASANNDGKAEADTELRSASNTGVASAT